MRKSTIAAIILLLLFTVLLIGYAINGKIKSKHKAEEILNQTTRSIAELRAINPVVNNYYPKETVVQQVNTNDISQIITTETKDYMAKLKADYDCLKLDVLNGSEVYLNCAKLTS